MTIDPAIQEDYSRLHPVYVAAAMAFGSNPPDHVNIPLPELRIQLDGFALQQRGKVPEVICYDKQIPFGDGKHVEVRIIRPPGTETEMLPGVVFFHGGGFIFGDKDTFLKATADLALRSRTAVVYVEYSKSPEVQYPIALEECYGVVSWMAKQGASVHVNPEKLAVAGDSAGGNLATAVCMLAKQRGCVDIIKTQIMMYPMTADGQLRETYDSVKRYGVTPLYGLSLVQVETATFAYCGKTSSPDPLISPLLCDDLSGLPPALVLTADCDVLRDEGEAYATKLMAAGVETVAIRVLGTVHGFFQMPVPETPHYHKSLSLIAAHLADIFSS
ncbi:alpha/beta hydrolase fold-domain-containing protein [Fennellomyces sp. T-0311]|nr:alpha/beta hydrolase fold-domain-containing protein [Fennellomyces sp. T-0311]